MTRIKDFKKARRNYQLLLIGCRLLQYVLGIVLGVCLMKTFFYQHVTAVVAFGTVCIVLAALCIGLLQKVIEEVKKGGVNSRLRQVENDRSIGERKRCA